MRHTSHCTYSAYTYFCFPPKPEQKACCVVDVGCCDMLTRQRCAAAGATHSSRRLVSTCKPRTCNLLVRCKGPGSSQPNEADDPNYAYSDPVNKFLGQFLPSNKAAKDELGDKVDFSQPKLKGLNIQKMSNLVEEGLTRSQWFVTGEVDSRLFSDNFAFKDESVATTGIKAYATGVRKLFDQATSKAELISVSADETARQIIVTWRLEGRVNLPFKPKIKPYVVTTTLGLNDEGLICSQLDEFSVPGYDLLLSIIFGEGFGAKPAPPVEELRKTAAAAAAAGQQAAAKAPVAKQ